MKKQIRVPSWIDWLGWIGVILVLGAYALLSFGAINSSYAFQIPTLVGSLAVAIECWAKKDQQPAILNLIFSVIALLAIFRLLILR